MIFFFIHEIILIFSENNQIIENLLANGANINIEGRFGDTSLLTAARNGAHREHSLYSKYFIEPMSSNLDIFFVFMNLKVFRIRCKFY